MKRLGRIILAIIKTAGSLVNSACGTPETSKYAKRLATRLWEVTDE
jgi:hypothetical protein